MRVATIMIVALFPCVVIILMRLLIKHTHVDAIRNLHERTVGVGIQSRLERLFQPETADKNYLRIADGGNILRPRIEGVRVGADGEENGQIDVFSAYLRNHISNDGRRCNYAQPID
jgi:hypothetical protein